MEWKGLIVIENERWIGLIIGKGKMERVNSGKGVNYWKKEGEKG